MVRHGKLVETGPTAQVINTPSVQYTRALIAATPGIERRDGRFRTPVEKTGEIDQWLFVSHDLAVVRRVSHRVAVMKQGKIVKCREAETLYDAPQNDHARMLPDTAPRATGH
ncbi:MAG: hypothetical protein AB8B60_04375 [Sulfitobacter sp.]